MAGLSLRGALITLATVGGFVGILALANLVSENRPTETPAPETAVAVPATPINSGSTQIIPVGGGASLNGVVPGERRWSARSDVNVRSGPGESYPVVRKLAAGEEVRVVPTGPGHGMWVRLGEPVGEGSAARQLDEWVHASLVATRGPSIEEEQRERAATEADNRRAYAVALRELFLDQGLDIEVRVTGSRAERLRLKYVLFNDVWSHRFDKDGLISQWLGMGFEKIELNDGYDYRVVWSP